MRSPLNRAIAFCRKNSAVRKKIYSLFKALTPCQASTASPGRALIFVIALDFNAPAGRGGHFACLHAVVQIV